MKIPLDGVDYAAIDEIAQNHIQGNVGLIVVTLAGEERRVAGFGRCSKGDDRTPDGQTLFEIGSITKVFTTCLLADMIARGDVRLTDPIKKYLPESLRVPTYEGQEIALEHLATHTSSLPRLPDNLEATIKDEANPYANYTVEDLYAFLSNCELSRPIGSRVEYSNLGVGLLGHLLARATGKTYEELVRARICEPLGMKDTAIALSPEQRQRLAPGHTADGKVTANWDCPTLAACGALRSTGTDMLAFLAACLGEGEPTVRNALCRCRLPRFGPRRFQAQWRPMMVALGLSVISVGAQWLTNLHPGSWLFAVAALGPPLVSAWFGGLWPGLLATLVTVGGTYGLWGENFGWFVTAGIGVVASWYLSSEERQAVQGLMLGWQYQALDAFGRGPRMTWHNGGTGGYSSFLGFVKERDAGVVVLNNSENSVDGVGVDILRILCRGR